MIPMAATLADEIAAAAARLVVEEGMEYGPAKRRAARSLGVDRPAGLPSNEQLEDQVRDYLALFRADSQPAELAALRELALAWLQRLHDFRPHLAGAVWRGTATRDSAIRVELYCDDPKAAEIELINRGLDYDVGSDVDGHDVLSLAARVPGWAAPVTVHLIVCDHDELRGALKPDLRGRTWRGDLAALQRLMAGTA
jgi:hypothetical protein